MSQTSRSNQLEALKTGTVEGTGVSSSTGTLMRILLFHRGLSKWYTTCEVGEHMGLWGNGVRDVGSHGTGPQFVWLPAKHHDLGWPLRMLSQ